MSFNVIKNSVNLVTGCGSGCGRETLKRLVLDGSKAVLGIDRTLPADLQQQLGLDEEQFSRITLDKRDTFDAGVEASIESFASKHGALDNVINAAGIGGSFVMYAKTKGRVYERANTDIQLKFNAVGTFNMIRLASKYMIGSANRKRTPNGNKCIINTSCITTHSPAIGHTGLAASKSAIDGMTLSVARELAPYSIRCNTIDIGFFNTRYMQMVDLKQINYVTEQLCVCPRRLGEPVEYYHLVKTIIENKMLNGVCIRLDAGATQHHYEGNF